MRCAKKCFVIFAMAISGTPMPKICFVPGQLKGTILPKECYGDSFSVGKSDTQPSNWKALSTAELSPPSEIVFANA